MSLVPLEFQGMARRLLNGFDADDLSIIEALAPAIRPLEAQHERGGAILPKQLIELARTWRTLPACGHSLARSYHREGRRLDLLETRLTMRGMRFKEWETGAKEASVALARITITIAPGIFDSAFQPFAFIGMHAIGRRFERGRPNTDASVIDDVLHLCRVTEGLLSAGGAFQVDVPSGHWVGNVLAHDKQRVAAVRTFLRARD